LGNTQTNSIQNGSQTKFGFKNFDHDDDDVDGDDDDNDDTRTPLHAAKQEAVSAPELRTLTTPD
jgi:hypothetical protein